MDVYSYFTCRHRRYRECTVMKICLTSDLLVRMCTNLVALRRTLLGISVKVKVTAWREPHRNHMAFCFYETATKIIINNIHNPIAVKCSPLLVSADR